MKSISFLSAAVLALSSWPSVDATPFNTCNVLSAFFPSKVVLPNTVQYTETNTDYYDAGNIRNPACIFLPTSAQDVSTGLRVIALGRIKWSLKSGGHMPGKGANNIGSEGVLIAMEKMTQLDWAPNSDVLRVGPGNRWGPVYNASAERGKIIIGGRRSQVGVPGLVTGGGLALTSGEYGFSCDNVVGFEVVLGDGRIVYATDTGKYTDLYKALRGGSGNFGIVTRFDLATYDVPVGWASIGVVDLGSFPAAKFMFIEALANYVITGSSIDAKSGAIGVYVNSPIAGINMGLTNLWRSAPQTNPETNVPAVFQEFTSIPGQHTNFNIPMANYITALDAFSGSSPEPMPNVFRTQTFVADKDLIKFITQVWDEEFDKIRSSVVGITTSLAFQPITVNQIQVGNNKRGGNVLGLESRTKPVFFTEQSISWALESDREKVQIAQREVARRAEEYAKPRGLFDPFLYLNDADLEQKAAVFPGYGTVNHEFLKKVQKKYDLFGVFKDLASVGFEI